MPSYCCKMLNCSRGSVWVPFSDGLNDVRFRFVLITQTSYCPTFSIFPYDLSTSQNLDVAKLGTMPRLATLLSLPLLAFGGCPSSMLPFRTSSVLNGAFQESRLSGFYYEQSYKDLAQIGASCQTMNVTATPSPDFGKNGSTMNIDFKVKYAFVPFTINELYTPVTDGDDNTGSYVKTVDMPGGSLLPIAIVMVDVHLDERTGTYDRFSMYGCIDGVEELYFVTRERTADAETMQEMYDTARSVGIDFKDEDLNVVEACR